MTQPWATLVAIGAKRIETRSWSTAYRGPIAIHAAKGFPRDCQELCYEYPFAEELEKARFNRTRDLPLGQIVAVTYLRSCIPVEDVYALHDRERAFGNYAPGRFAWLFGEIRRLRQPIPCKGALGLWTVPTDIVEQIQRAV